MGPIQYGIGGPDPSQMLLQGLGTGLQINQLQQQQAAAQAQAQAQADQAERQAVMNAELEAASRDPIRLVPALMIKYPELAQKLSFGVKEATAAQAQGMLQSNGEVAAALASGNPEIAVGIYERRQNLLREQGDNQAADEIGKMIEVVRTNPQAALTATMARISVLPGGKEAVEALNARFKDVREAAKAPDEQRSAKAAADKAEQDAIRARIQAAFEERAQLAALELSDAQRKSAMNAIYDRARRFALDERRLALETAEKMGELPTATLDPAAKKLVADASLNAAAQTQTAEQLESLAARVGAANIGSGAFSWIAEKVKGAGGWQGEISSLRNEYARVRNSLAIKSLPPGPATDKDIELALRGFPSEYASGDEIARFLRGMAKMQRIDAEVSNAQAQWVGAFRNNGPARADVEIAGVPVKRGEPFSELAKRINVRAQQAAASQEPQGQTDSGATFSGWGSTP
jgi:hypothetical protein